MLNSQELVCGGYLHISIEEVNRNVGRYVIVLVDREEIWSEHKYSTLKIVPKKKVGEGELNEDKVYVLAAHEKNLVI